MVRKRPRVESASFEPLTPEVQQIVAARERRKKQLLDAGAGRKEASRQATLEENNTPEQIKEREQAQRTKDAQQLAQSRQSLIATDQALQTDTTNLDSTTPETPDFTFGEAVSGAAPDIASKAITSGLQGAAVLGGGALLTGVGAPLAAPLAVAGFAGGVLATAISEIKEEYQQQRDVVYTDFAGPTGAVANINNIIKGVDNGLIEPEEARTLFYNELAKVDRTERQLKQLEEKDWLSKARKRLNQVQNFNDVSRQDAINRFNAALLAPDATMDRSFQVPSPTDVELPQ